MLCCCVTNTLEREESNSENSGLPGVCLVRNSVEVVFYNV